MIQNLEKHAGDTVGTVRYPLGKYAQGIPGEIQGVGNFEFATLIENQKKTCPGKASWGQMMPSVSAVANAMAPHEEDWASCGTMSGGSGPFRGFIFSRGKTYHKLLKYLNFMEEQE